MNRTRRVLREYGYSPRKRRGQHFLVRESALRGITAAAGIEEGETVLEIGPGPGNLTRRLLQAGARVIAVELEPELSVILKAELSSDRLQVITADVLTVDFAEFAAAAGRLKVVANLPYNITTPLLYKFLDQPSLFSRLFLLVQKEVAERLTASPGSRAYGILAVHTQLHAAAEIVLEVGPEAFSPRPKVRSALVRLEMREKPLVVVRDVAWFRRVVRAAFARRRKTLANSFAAEMLGRSRQEVVDALIAADIDPARRAETVTIPEFAELARILAGKGKQGA